MVVEFGEQRYEFDIECPRGLDKKNPTNQFLFYKFAKAEDDNLTIYLEERIYKLERDEAAFLQSIRNVNAKQSTSINQLLLNQQRNTGGGPLGTPNTLLKKKKVH